MKLSAYSLIPCLAVIALTGCSTPEGPLERTGRTADKIGRDTVRSVERGAEATGRTLKKSGEQVGETLR
jgi:hypothetical protein